MTPLRSGLSKTSLTPNPAPQERGAFSARFGGGRPKPRRWVSPLKPPPHDRIISPAMKRYLVWMVLILLAAAALRLVALPDLPPGLTHDEADHGLSAWGVVNGVRPLYFTVGYGREPLYDYLTAGLMTVLGPSYLAGRLISVYLSLFLIAGMATWAPPGLGTNDGFMDSRRPGRGILAPHDRPARIAYPTATHFVCPGGGMVLATGAIRNGDAVNT